MTLSPLRRARLAAIAADFADRPESWRALVRHDPDQRSFTRLHHEDDYEVWVLGWDRGQGLELHDHGGAAGAFAVVDGRLVEAHTDLARKSLLRWREWHTGERRTFGATHVHPLTNPGPGVATSVHVYSPPLTAMTLYDHRPGSFLVPWRTEHARDSAALVG